MDISLFKKSLGYVETTRPIAISFHELAALSPGQLSADRNLQRVSSLLVLTYNNQFQFITMTCKL